MEHSNMFWAYFQLNQRMVNLVVIIDLKIFYSSFNLESNCYYLSIRSSYTNLDPYFSQNYMWGSNASL